MESGGPLSRLGRLSQEKRANFFESLLEEVSLSSEYEPIPPRPQQDFDPLSYAQQRLWFLDQIEPGNPAYNIPMSVRLSGRLQISALGQAVNEIVRRHEALRTSFPTLDGGPIQRIAKAQPTPLPIIDLSGLESEAGEKVAHLMRREEARRPFVLATGPLLRVELLRQSDQEHIALQTMHHIISDGWSMGVLIGEVGRLYVAYAEGRPSPLEELPVQYADFAHWQRQWLQGEVLENQLSYWRQALDGAPPVLELLTDYVRPTVKTYRGASHGLSLSEELTQKLKGISHGQGATLFMTLLAAFQTLLSRYSGQRDVLVGIPIAGRTRKETENLIGFFVNMLVMRGELSETVNFLELLARVRETAIGAFSNQDVPFEKLVEELQPKRDRSRSPLFQVIFQLQNAPRESLQLPGLRLHQVGVEPNTAQFDLTMRMSESGQILSGGWVYNRDLFEEMTISRMISHFQHLLTGIVMDPKQPVCELSLMSESERQQMVVEWNRTARPYESELIHELFERQARNRPDAIAVVNQEQQLSYGELNQRANQLSNYLSRLEVRPEVLVGVCVERSAEMVIGLLGVLKAGGAYVPLDAKNPEQRLAYLLGETAVGVVLSQSRLAEKLSGYKGEVVCLDTQWDRIAGAGDERSQSGVNGANTAYVIYTSGSTGEPKGVMLSHAAVANHNQAIAELFELGPADRVLQFHSISFDAAVEELYPVWLSGGAVILRSEEVIAPGEELSRLIELQGLTVLDLPTVYWHEWVREQERGGQAAPSSLRLVVVGGEKTSIQRLESWRRINNEDLRWVNTYGPTEAAVSATAYEAAQNGSKRREAPIGRPLANVRSHILDARMRPAPVGVVGDLYLGGAGLCRGYLKRPEQTAERFAPDPFGSESGGRLYRTGDQARYLADGEIEFVGRADAQVKVRGYRIELGEVEGAIGELEWVREAVVEAREGERGAKRLVGYVVGKPEAEDGVELLREHLGRRLPEYMIPASYIFLESLPKTSGGKVNRRALPAPEELGREPESYQGPRNELEQWLEGQWRGALGLERIGVRENFFELGGDSIKAAILINRLQKELEEYVYVLALFEAPTIAGLAEYLVQRYREAIERKFPGLKIAQAARTAAIVEEEQVEALRRSIPRLASWTGQEEKNPRAVFILSSTRSGSTLLRVMLGGHSRLFAPPELELLGYETLAQRREALEGRYQFFLEGSLRALMQLEGCDLEQARKQMSGYEAEGMSVKRFYGRLQEMMGERILVDKTVSYALDVGILKRAESYFGEARYIHLVRQPEGMIRSFERVRAEDVAWRYGQGLRGRELAEAMWVISQRNILEFLNQAPEERQKRVKFEELVKEPRRVMEDLSEFLGVEMEEGMLKPYEEKSERMTDAVHPLSKMIGDVRFHEHREIDQGAAERWKQEGERIELGRPARELAEMYGYEVSGVVKRYGKMERVERRENLPLSYAQQRLWFLNQLEPESAAYNMPLAVRLRGWLKIPALGQTFSEIVRRHEALRTSFHSVGGEPAQKIAERQLVAMPIIDLSGLNNETRKKIARRLGREEALRMFDLSQGALLRVALLRHDNQEYIALLTMHHIISDGWSQGVLIGEVGRLYHVYAQGEPSTLGELSIQYVDYAVWQQERLQGETLDAQLSYWKQALREVLPVLQLPTDHARPAAQNYRGASRGMRFSESLAQGVRELSRREGVTLFMTLLAAYQILLARYSGQSGMLIGTAIAGRTRKETEALIGFFVNTLVMRGELRGNPTFRQLLERVRDVALGAYAHQDLPFEYLVEALQPERSLSHSPLFQVMFILQNAPKQQLGLPGLKLEAVGGENQTAKFDLTLHMSEVGSALSGSLGYRTDLFEASTISRMLTHFQNLLAGIVAAPETRLGELPLLSETEREQLLSQWAWNRVEYEGEQCLHELFERQVERSPEAIAIYCEGQALSYGELNRRANQLAHQLQEMGVGLEARVGICLERSLEMVIGLVGILKAGGTYLPLDPDYPKPRLSYMLEDSRPAVVLSQSALINRLPDHNSRVICFDVDWEKVRRQSAVNPISGAMADSVAYVIYTSGSTGTPKGVMGLHRGAVNRCRWMWENYPFAEGEVGCQKTSLNFIDSVWEIFGPLLKGTPNVIVPGRVVKDAAELMGKLREQRVTRLVLVPSLLSVLLEYCRKATDCGGQLKLWICSGEKLSEELARSFATSKMEGELLNLYGSSEVSADVSWSQPEEAVRTVGIAPIGRPISNTGLYILNESMQPTPVGVSGELYVGGEGLARGYSGRPDLTAEKFVPDELSRRVGGRFYRTGDVCRYLTNGEIEYLGRIDHQVKIRGYRVELGEIESTLSQHPDVEKAIGLVREDVIEDRCLVAYVVAKPGKEPSVSELRGFLKERLPEYMAPAAYVLLDELPLTPNGKVDRKALPAPKLGGERLEEEAIGYTNPIEEAMGGIWCEILKRDWIGAEENFFELGGHSLMATRVISRVREMFQVELPLRSLFESPTIRALAEQVEKAMKVGSRLLAPPLCPTPRVGSLPLSYAQQRLWFLHQLDPGSSTYHIPAAVKLEGRLKIAALDQAISEIVRRHEALRTSFPAQDGEPVQRFAEACTAPLPVIDLSGVDEESRKQLARRLSREESQRWFDLSTGPLLRVRLLRLSGEAHHALLTMHHIISDGWSMGILTGEMGHLYGAYTQGGPSPLKELPAQYADYALWQREWLRGEALDLQLSYWRKTLDGAPHALKLPSDHLRPSEKSSHGASRSWKLSESISQEIRDLSRRENVTLFMTLLAAFDGLLHYYTGQDDILVGTPIANRVRTETESMIGFFVNALVMRTDLSGNPTFEELLKRVRETCLGAYANQDLPFEQLVQELRPERISSQQPLFQASFVLQNTPPRSLSLPDLTIRPLSASWGRPQFDLILQVVDRKAALVLSLRYNTELFTPARIKHMGEDYDNLLQRIIAQPDIRLGALHEGLLEANRKRIVTQKEELREVRSQNLRGMKKR